MGRRINGTNGNDTIIQSQFTNNAALIINTFAGNDQVKLDRTGDLGGDNTVNTGAGRDVVVNLFEGGNRIALGGGNDTYVGTGFSSLGGSDVVDGGAGADQFFVSTLQSAYLGGLGNDRFASHGWENGFDGGAGIDTISYEFRHEDSVIGDTGVIIDLLNNRVQTGAQRFEQVFNIEDAIGSLRADIIQGNNGNNVLMGLAEDDNLFGLNGNDTLAGGLDNDFLTGGLGADRFFFGSTAESRRFDGDTIFDFNRTQGDVIDLASIDARTTANGDQAFAFIGGAAFSGVAGQLRYAGGLIQMDTNGDRVADAEIILDNAPASLLATDFLL